MKNATVSDDYVHVHLPGVGTLYYGYEVTHGEDDEWCFVATISGRDTVIPFSELPGAREEFDVVENVLIGLAEIVRRDLLKASDR